jgi:sulfite exporter TauE/SafE
VADAAVLSLAGTVLAASLLGSAHCAGMCGGIALAAAGPGSGLRIPQQIGYHGGRLASYALVGALAGFAGSAVDDAGVLVGVQRVAAMVAGLSIAGFGLVALLRAFGARIPHAQVPRPLVALAQRVHARTLRLPPAWRGVPLGLATPLLPCGWLYAFVAIAAASAGVIAGAAVMAAFWAGTVPAVVVAANGARAVFARLGRFAPVALGVGMLAIGLHAAFFRAELAPVVADAARERTARLASLHDGDAGLEADAANAVDEVPPCCRRSE